MQWGRRRKEGGREALYSGRDEGGGGVRDRWLAGWLGGGGGGDEKTSINIFSPLFLTYPPTHSSLRRWRKSGNRRLPGTALWWCWKWCFW